MFAVWSHGSHERPRAVACHCMRAVVAQLPAAVTAPLLAGAFDGALRAAPAVWRARAEEVGWREVPGVAPGPPRAGLESHRAAQPGPESHWIGPLVSLFRRQQAAAASAAQGGAGDPQLVQEPD